MKKVQLIILLALFCATTEGFSILRGQFQNNITGICWSPTKDAKIEIYSKGQYYHAEFVWLKSSKSDCNKPVKFLQSRAVWGLELLEVSLFGPTEKFEKITKK